MEYVERKQDEDQSVKWEKKKVSIAGFTEKLRKQELERKTKKLSSKGWELLEYQDEGMSKSYAIFRRPLEYSSPKEAKSLSPGAKKFWKYLGYAVCLLFAIGLIGSLTESDEAKQQRIAKKEAQAYSQFLNKKIGTMKGITSKEEKKNGLSFYLAKNDISPSLLPLFYNYLSQSIHTKNEGIAIGTVLDWGRIEISANGGSFAKNYYDLDNIESQFSAWDGSHIKLEELIKMNMKDADSYEHVETRYSLVLHGSGAPYMNVATIYSGTNSYGARVKGRVAAKVSIEDGSILSISE